VNGRLFDFVTANWAVLGIALFPHPLSRRNGPSPASERDAYGVLWSLAGRRTNLIQKRIGSGHCSLLYDAAPQTLPEKSVLMLHPGIGLGFAQGLLVCLEPPGRARDPGDSGPASRRGGTRTDRACRQVKAVASPAFSINVHFVNRWLQAGA
jgi:hypothetical protein